MMAENVHLFHIHYSFSPSVTAANNEGMDEVLWPDDSYGHCFGYLSIIFSNFFIGKHLDTDIISRIN